MCRSMVDIQSPTAEIRRGKKKRRKKIDRKKSQGKNIMVCPITYGDHNERNELKQSEPHFPRIGKAYIVLIEVAKILRNTRGKLQTSEFYV